MKKIYNFGFENMHFLVKVINGSIITCPVTIYFSVVMRYNMYDETYGVIYEVIARKLRAFMEPF